MPGPRQPDHKLNKDRSVIDKYSRVFVTVQNVAASQLVDIFANFSGSSIDMVLPRQILIN